MRVHDFPIPLRRQEEPSLDRRGHHPRLCVICTSGDILLYLSGKQRTIKIIEDYSPITLGSVEDVRSREGCSVCQLALRLHEQDGGIAPPIDQLLLYPIEHERYFRLTCETRERGFIGVAWEAPLQRTELDVSQIRSW